MLISKIQGYLGVWMVLLSKIKVNIHQFSHFKQTFETCIMGANDDLDYKTTHFDWFLHSNNKGTKIPITGQSAVCSKSEVTLSSPSKSWTFWFKFTTDRLLLCRSIVINLENKNIYKITKNPQKPLANLFCSFVPIIRSYLFTWINLGMLQIVSCN